MRRMYYQTTWPKSALYCPLGKRRFQPNIEVWAIDSATIPYREIDKLAGSLTTGTYEDAAEYLAKGILAAYGGKIRVRVGEPNFWAETAL